MRPFLLVASLGALLGVFVGSLCADEPVQPANKPAVKKPVIKLPLIQIRAAVAATEEPAAKAAAEATHDTLKSVEVRGEAEARMTPAVEPMRATLPADTAASAETAPPSPWEETP